MISQLIEDSARMHVCCQTLGPYSSSGKPGGSQVRTSSTTVERYLGNGNVRTRRVSSLDFMQLVQVEINTQEVLRPGRYEIST